MDRLNKEYIELLSEDANLSDKFWSLDMNEDAIRFEALEEFSDQLKETVRFIVER